MADATPTPTTPDTPSPAAMMLSGPNMGGGMPQFDTPMPNVQPGQQPGVTTAAGPSYSADPSQQAQQPTGITPSTDPEMVAGAVAHERGARALDAISKAIGGSKTMHVIEQPDGSFVAKEMDSTPGERWSRIARAALQGAAAGFAHGQGPGGGAKAFSAGVDTGLSLPQQQQDQTMKKADDLESQREKGIMFKKNMALADLQGAKLHLEVMQSPIKFNAEMTKYADDQRAAMGSLHGKFLAHYANTKDLSDHLQTNQELLDNHVGNGGTLMQIPTYSGGQQTGVDVFGIPEDTLNQYNDKPETVMIRHLAPDNKSMVTETRTYAPGTELMKNIIADRKTQDTQNQSADLNFAKLQNENTEAAAAKTKADADAKEVDSRIAKNYADAAKAANDSKDPQKKLTNEVDQHGNPILVDKFGNLSASTPPAGLTPIKATDMATFRTKFQSPAIKADGAYNMMKNADQNNPEAQRTAVKLAMQEAGVLAPGQGVGGKGGMSLAEFKSAASNTRGLADDKVNLIGRFISGQQITPTQWSQILQSYTTMRHAMWRTAAEAGAVQGLKPEDVIPADTPGRDNIMGEIYANRTPQPGGGGNTSQAARAPGAAPDAVKPIPQPPGATMKVPGSDGKLHWSDGAKDLGVAQ